MLTKRELCEAIVNDQCEELNCARNEAHNAIFQSSLLAVALDYLGELSPMEEEYAKERGGALFRYLDKDPIKHTYRGIYFLTLRELVDLLPDEYDHTDEMWED